MKKYSEELNSNDKHLSNAVMATYLNLKELLSNKEAEFIEKHLDGCTSCREKYELLKLEDAEIVPGKSINNKVRLTYWYAAAAVILITFGIGYYIIYPPVETPVIAESEDLLFPDTTLSAPQPDLVTEDKTEIKEKPVKISEADFASNQILENFINRNIRSETKVRILSPQIGDTINIPSKFEWQSSAQKFKLSVVNNLNKEVYVITTEETRLVLRENLKPGLYYWKILVDEKLETVGKFYILN